MSSLSKSPSLNKLQMAGPVWLASDIHLSENNPATALAFYDFLEDASQQASALFILGDLFDVWVGDDVIKHPASWLKQALDALARCAACIPVYVGLGNRDFLLGVAFIEQIGAHPLADKTLLSVGPTTVLISHGDEYCTLDHSYQRFKWWVRQPWVQSIFKCLSLSQRLKIASQARAQSIKKMAQLSNTLSNTEPDIVDVSTDAVTSGFSQFGVNTIIHGHTHRPGQQCHDLDGKVFTRWVLPDWEYDHLGKDMLPRGGHIEISDQGVDLVAKLKLKNNERHNQA
jgi:UDP-2,3-diacylglucosamine hydrolase